ncbi:MAG: CHASE domain-containing protein, partial [Candidatus Abyssubacteria bacterium]|nr:CHASE domain-containing protein [Candidatus Abyssubacteria bacterium]
MKKRMDNSRPHRSSYPHIPVVLTLLLGVTLSLTGFFTARYWEYQRVQDRFETSAEKRDMALVKNIELSLHELEGLGALFAASQKVEREEFGEFVKPFLSRYPGIQALEWIPHVPDSRRSAYEEAARRDGFPGFQFTERNTSGKMVRAATREDYFPVYFVEPYEGNEVAFGYDLASEPMRLEALNRCRNTGKPVATGRITLVQETGTQFGFLIFQPVYRKGTPTDSVKDRREALEGFVLGVFRIGDVIKASLPYANLQKIDCYLYDESVPTDEQFLFSYLSPTSKARAAPIDDETVRSRKGLHSASTFDVAGREWLLVCRPTPDYMLAGRTWQPWGILLLALLLTGALTVRTKHNITHTAELDAANQQLRREIIQREQFQERIEQQKKFLETVLESLSYPFYVIDANDYTIKLANSAARSGSVTADSTCFAAFHGRREPCETGRHECPIEEVKRTKKAVIMEQIRKDENGDARYVEVHS